MRYVILVLAFLLPTHAWAQTQPSSTRVTNSNGSVAAAVQSTATAGTEAGLVVRVAGSVTTTGGSNASVGTNGATAPTSSTQVGLVDVTTGNLVPIAGLDVDPTAGTINAQAVIITGTGTASTLGIVSERNGTFDNGGVAPLMQDNGGVARVPRVYDTDSTGGAEYTQGVILRSSAGGASNEAGTTAAPLIVREAPGASIVSGQQAVTASAVALPSVAVRQVCVTHMEGGAVSTIYVGASGVTTSDGWPLPTGTGICLPVDSVADVFVVASGVGSSVAYVGVP